ncbi:hypothetical protein LO772_11980 [Yinghuangia sp. ASG 101]|uniref:hypothetical protein n=1 Tax=Yinghuangia sp. ASG 101 TaxID=2896848 RepID=UPI001E586A26|nr:hypothetical protein [Yinghuangia sp. ASG 101]UGQ14241.1 hypothetical protein LO772_11980 [Yinghuangia sp. ASG 101]
MKSFEREVLAILERLNVEHLPAVDAIPTQLVPAAFGTGFVEADDTASRVLAVVEEVRNFARMLHKQIEALALTIRMATDSTAATEEENKRKLLLLIQAAPGEQPAFNVPAQTPAPGDPSKSGVPPRTPGAPVPGAGSG